MFSLQLYIHTTPRHYVASVRLRPCFRYSYNALRFNFTTSLFAKGQRVKETRNFHFSGKRISLCNAVDLEANSTLWYLGNVPASSIYVTDLCTRNYWHNNFVSWNNVTVSILNFFILYINVSVMYTIPERIRYLYHFQINISFNLCHLQVVVLIINFVIINLTSEFPNTPTSHFYWLMRRL